MLRKRSKEKKNIFWKRNEGEFLMTSTKLAQSLSLLKGRIKVELNPD